MIKRLLAIWFVFTLVSCSSREDNDKKAQDEYMTLSCDQLNDKRDSLNEEIKKIKEKKDTMDGVKTAINVLAIVSILTGGGGNTCSDSSGEDIQETDCKRKLEILREVMVKKKCDACHTAKNTNKIKSGHSGNGNIVVENKSDQKNTSSNQDVAKQKVAS